MTLKYAMRNSAPFIFGHSIRVTVSSVDLFKARCRVAKAIWEGDVPGTVNAVKAREEVKRALRTEQIGLVENLIQFPVDIAQPVPDLMIEGTNVVKKAAAWALAFANYVAATKIVLPGVTHRAQVQAAASRVRTALTSLSDAVESFKDVPNSFDF